MWKDPILSPKGQITLPKEVRDALSLEPGDTVVLTVSNGRLILAPKNLNFNDLAGFLGHPPKGAASLDEIDETIAEEASRKAVAPLRRKESRAA